MKNKCVTSLKQKEVTFLRREENQWRLHNFKVATEIGKGKFIDIGKK